MEKLLTVLSEVRADIDYRETDDLIDGGYSSVSAPNTTHTITE